MRAQRSFAILALFAIVAVHPSASADTAELSVVGGQSTPSSYAFSPATIFLTPEDGARWTNQTPSVSHTATNKQRFWSADIPVADASPVVPMAWSGRYLYSCTIHPDMQGVVDVPLSFSSGPYLVGVPFTVRWASQAVPARQNIDVQVKRPGARRYRAWRGNQTGLNEQADYIPTKAGTYTFRVRRQFTRSGKATPWELTEILVT